ncbi:hypothetical protein MS6204_00014 [Escherichia coli]|nr:hypothetical protein [Escherichia coli]
MTGSPEYTTDATGCCINNEIKLMTFQFVHTQRLNTASVRKQFSQLFRAGYLRLVIVTRTVQGKKWQ